MPPDLRNYIATGYTDLRGGIDRLSALIKERFSEKV